MTVAFLALVAFGAAVAEWRPGGPGGPGSSGPPISHAPDAIALLADAEGAESPRPNYRYSVIPHGAYTGAELGAAMRRDPIVAREYGSVSPADIRTARVDAPRLAYMSYRVGDRIYWTKDPVTLAPGEAILTDGTTEIRARCGNGISSDPQQPTLDAEPATVEFERLVGGPSDPPAGVPDAALAAVAHPMLASARSPFPLTGTPVTAGLGRDPGDTPSDAVAIPATPWPALELPIPNGLLWPGPPLVPGLPPSTDPPWPPGGDLPVITTGPPPGQPVPVPEPGTLVLVALGAGGMMLRHWRRRRSPQQLESVI